MTPLEKIWFGFGMCSALCAIATTVMLNRYFRFHHPQTWEELGKPTFWNNSPANNIRGMKFFLLGNKYKQLNDPVVNRYVVVTRMCGLFVIAYMVAWAFFISTGGSH